MTASEFDEQAEQIGHRIRRLDGDRRIAAACRGSAIPEALEWLATTLHLTRSTALVDLGAGLGGPLAWFRAHHGCEGIALEPSHPAISAARSVFGLRALRASAVALPVRDGAFDVALLLGVVSVVDDPAAALLEARRVGRRLGVLDYCATADEPVAAGGSRFPTPAALSGLLDATGWRIDRLEPVRADPPARWRDVTEDLDVDPDPAEEEVVDAIEAGALAPVLVAAR